MLGERLVRWRVGWQWYVLVILGPAAFSLAIAGVYALLGGSWSAAVPKALSEEPLVLLPVFFLILALTDGWVRSPLGEASRSRDCLPGTTPWWPA